MVGRPRRGRRDAGLLGAVRANRLPESGGDEEAGVDSLATAVRFPAPHTESGDSIGFRCASDTIDEAELIGLIDISGEIL